MLRISFAFAVVLLLASNLRAQQNTSIDYLEPALRAQVEQLKKDVTAEATTKDNGPERAMILWDWANAYALAGGVLPVDLPSLVARLGGQKNTKPGGLRQLDRYVRELTIRDEQPTAIGSLKSAADDPFLPGSYVTIRQTYHFGDTEMVPGGGFFVAKHFMSNQGRYQATDPHADNYITIHASNAGAKFVVDARPMGGMHGGFRGSTPGLFFRLSEGILTPRDSVTITYGDRSGGSNGFKVQTYSNDAFPLPLYVDLKGNRELITLPIETYGVTGGSVQGVHAFAPSVVKTGERFSVSVRSEDKYRNRASGQIPAYEVELNGTHFAEIPMGDHAITMLRDIHLDQEGVYRFNVASADGSIVGKSNPIWVQDDPRLRIYWGDTHGHCGFAEGQGTPEAFFEFGRNDARLDFLTHSEHDIWMDDAEWQTLIDNVDKYNQDGEFVAILGYEWTSNTLRGGHHNVFFRDTNNRKRVPNQTASVLSQLYRRLATENDMDDVLIIPHAHQSGEYRMNDPNMETLVEIMSMHGNFEWFGRIYLQHGHEVGFVAASDDHLSHPGYASPLPSGLAQPGGLAAVLAPERTRDSIFSAMKNLAAYATTQQRIILDVEVNGARMGTRTEYAPQRVIRGRVMGTASIAEVSILKNGEVISSKDLVAEQDAEAEGTNQRLELSFYSESDPHVRDNPYGWRPWQGSLKVEGAKLRNVSSPAMSNPLSEFVRRDDGQPNRVNFSLFTRGSHKNVVLDLQGIGDDAAVEVYLPAVREGSGSPTVYRKKVMLTENEIRFTLSDLQNGISESRRSIQGIEESVTLRRMRNDVPLDYEFEVTDTESPQQGDYYFVRVRQLDGGMAWSSPVWIGGFSKRHEHHHYHD